MLIYYAIPGFIFLLGMEVVLSLRHTARGANTIRGYEWRDALVSIAFGIGSLITKLPVIGTIYLLNSSLYEFRLFDFPDSWWIWPILIVSEDFCYYWFHRLHHQVRILWAGHINHHSSEYYNLSTALRQPWTTMIVGMLFWAPLALLGFTPEQIIVAQSISLIYQYWIHTELIGKLGPLEWMFNTPSHHRVHHGRNPIYLDKNHGGILILWDRMFGSFQVELESEPVDFGLTTNIHSFNVLNVAFHEYIAAWRDTLRASTWKQRLAYLLGPPGWSPDGSRKTSKQQRAEALSKAK